MKLHNSVTETTDRGLYATLNRVQRIRELSKDFLLIGRNAWLSQQISPNSTMKILETNLIDVLLWFVRNLRFRLVQSVHTVSFGLGI